MTNENLNGALTGVALAAAAHWARYDDDTQRRLRNVRLDTQEALDLIRDLVSRGEMVRARLPTLMDTQIGLAIASPAPNTPSLIPSTIPQARPDLFDVTSTSVAQMKWPPVPGKYDDRGLVKEVGELTTLFLALTYEEDRAFLQGLVQARPPTADAKLQIFYAANALVAQLAAQNLTWQQYKDAWARLFTGGLPAPAVATHNDPGKPPTILAMDAGVSSIKARGLPDLVNYPFKHNNTDHASKWRLTVGGANISADTALVTYQFGSPYVGPDGAPFEPAIALSHGWLFVANTTPSGFVIKNNVALTANSVLDFSIVAG
ncbi:MAG: hypothetical protein U1A78_30740 [Polyangia bacterium]